MEINTEHFKLDKFHLEEAACKQASLYQFYAQLSADKQKELDKRNLQLEQLEAQRKIEFRASGTKLTQDQVDCLVATDNDLISYRADIIDLKHELATLKTAVLAMEQKRAMIEVEAKLQNNALYQQNDRIGDHSSAEWAEDVLRKQLNAKMGKSDV